ncbi:hypothetical protein AA0117_g6786 [Alternaria alternata]|uniref:Uncharacterized protein n=1 Tax=Alternaria alternata TaxID=5599 RepID=A0A4Q4NE15_ALTAL|nr:hypothetical protein AA0117_g6786 [Alternaria alternata]
MKFSTFATLISLSVVLAAVLDTRQECSQNDCYRAVWRDGGLPRMIQAGQDCQDFLTTSVIWNPMFIKHHPYGHYSNNLYHDDTVLSDIDTHRYESHSAPNIIGR